MADENVNLPKYRITVSFVIPDHWSVANNDELRGIIKDELFDEDFCEVNEITDVSVGVNKVES